MVYVILSIISLFSSLVLLVLGNSMLGTVAALRLEIEGFNPSTAGLILAFFSIGFVAGSRFGVEIIVRVGHIRAFAVFGALAASVTLIHPLYISAAGWMVLRLVLGFCIAGLMLVVESWTNSRATSENRGKLLATYMLLFYMAASAGQFLIILGDPGLHHLFIFSAILICLSLIPVSLTRSPAPDLELQDRMSIENLWRVSALGVAGAVLSGVILSAFSALGPIYALQMGLRIEQVATFMGIAILAAMALQWPIGYISDFYERRKVLLILSGVGAAASILTAFMGGLGAIWLYCLVPLFYGVAACLYPIALALTHDSSGQEKVVPTSATFLLVFGIGTIVGPILGGVSMSLFGPSGLFVFMTVALTLLTISAAGVLSTTQAPSTEDQEHCFGIAPVSTSVIMELDPRNEEFNSASSS